MFLQYLDIFYFFPFSIDLYGFKVFTPIFIIIVLTLNTYFLSV